MVLKVPSEGIEPQIWDNFSWSGSVSFCRVGSAFKRSFYVQLFLHIVFGLQLWGKRHVGAAYSKHVISLGKSDDQKTAMEFSKYFPYPKVPLTSLYFILLAGKERDAIPPWDIRHWYHFVVEFSGGSSRLSPLGSARHLKAKVEEEVTVVCPFSRASNWALVDLLGKVSGCCISTSCALASSRWYLVSLLYGGIQCLVSLNPLEVPSLQ